MHKITWPFVALVAIGLAAVVAVLAIIPPSDAQGRSVILVILNIIGPLISTIYLDRRINGGGSDGDAS